MKLVAGLFSHKGLCQLHTQLVCPSVVIDSADDCFTSHQVPFLIVLLIVLIA